MPIAKAELPFWQISLPVLLEQIKAGTAGLSRAEAAERLNLYGPNLIHGEHRRALVLQFLVKFRNPLVIMLLVASGLSAFTGDATSFFIIGAIVLLPCISAGIYLGFTAPPPLFFLVLVAMLVLYLLSVEGMKRWFFHRFAED